jgi:hypothetical protein
VHVALVQHAPCVLLHQNSGFGLQGEGREIRTRKKYAYQKGENARNYLPHENKYTKFVPSLANSLKFDKISGKLDCATHFRVLFAIFL